MFAADFTRKQLMAAICCALAAITLLIYAPMLRHGFVNYDDPDYITGNAHVTSGLTWANVEWAFTTGYAANWHPLTWISHMMDCGLFRLNPAGHHLTNLLFHIANTLLLFVLLEKLTGALWRSFFVAALFAWHPLHVESVAWASERKDVLSAFFWMLTLLAYARFVDLSKVHPPSPSSGATRNPKSKVFYILTLFLFACGLMSKPMIVTLPFVLLLMDFWPLERFTIYDLRFTIFRLFLEKIPFFTLSLASCLITYSVQSGALWSTQSLSFHFRLANALMSYVRYISKIFCPTDLALIYPYPHFWPFAGVIVAAGLLAMLSAIFILQAKRFPYLPVGWFWFLGTLIPAIGLVQVGVQSMADRYTYLPSIGIFILVVWGVNDLLNSRVQKIKIAALAGSLILIGCLVCTSIQLRYWRSSAGLFLHAVEVTTDNYAAEDGLGKALEDMGKNDDAEKLYAEAVSIEPDYPMAQFDLGMALLENGRPDEASNHLAIAVQLSPRNPVMQFDFGTYLSQHGQPDEAAAHFKIALADKPDFIEARRQLEKNFGKTNSSPANRSTR
ncbi:MAG TPA: tetratricopeptide repeat protein [Verrucomicrobiae bacterium]|jgi:tetratricopeptide (TPR) repeat protein|nr:tetratricopeptide repeat protein [Verrucomicrobiae bacterium]